MGQFETGEKDGRYHSNVLPIDLASGMGVWEASSLTTYGKYANQSLISYRFGGDCNNRMVGALGKDS